MSRLAACTLLFPAFSLTASACNLIADSEPRLRDGVADVSEIPAEDVAEFRAETEGETPHDPADTAVDDPQEPEDLVEEEYCPPHEIWYADFDEDGFGDSEVFICSPVQPERFVSNADDCCDEEFNAKPGQTDFFEVPYMCHEEELWDYDCDGLIELEIRNPAVFRYCHELLFEAECNAYLSWTDATDPYCGVTSELNECAWAIPDGPCAFYRNYYGTQGCR